MIALAVPSFASADETSNSDQSSAAPSTNNQKKDENKTAEGTAQETENNRAKTLEGSQSPFSGQIQFQYNGSSLSHPFDSEAPNPTGAPVPPAVKLTGTASARYRIDPATTAGLGVGFRVDKPFQGFDNPSVNEPYADIARSLKTWNIHHRVDFQYTLYTSHQYNDKYGYRHGLSLVDEAFYEFNFGLSVGIILEVDYNFFSSDTKYYSAYGNQTKWDLVTSPYFEYVLNKTFNLRSVIGIEHDHNRDMSGQYSLQRQGIYQTLGLGAQATDWVFLYIYADASWDHLNMQNTTFGVSAIINLF